MYQIVFDFVVEKINKRLLKYSKTSVGLKGINNKVQFTSVTVSTTREEGSISFLMKKLAIESLHFFVSNGFYQVETFLEE